MLRPVQNHYVGTQVASVYSRHEGPQLSRGVAWELIDIDRSLLSRTSFCLSVQRCVPVDLQMMHHVWYECEGVLNSSITALYTGHRGVGRTAISANMPRPASSRTLISPWMGSGTHTEEKKGKSSTNVTHEKMVWNHGGCRRSRLLAKSANGIHPIGHEVRAQPPQIQPSRNVYTSNSSPHFPRVLPGSRAAPQEVHLRESKTRRNLHYSLRTVTSQITGF